MLQIVFFYYLLHIRFQNSRVICDNQQVAALYPRNEFSHKHIVNEAIVFVGPLIHASVVKYMRIRKLLYENLVFEL